MNGTPNPDVFKPLSAHAVEVLQGIARSPRPRQEVNAGVAQRFEREGLTETYDAPSPFKRSAGRQIAFMRITAAGRARLGHHRD